MISRLLFPFGSAATARFARVAVLAMAAALSPTAASAAPGFIITGQYEEMQSIVLAEDVDGAITAFDLYLYFDMSRNRLARLPVSIFLAAADAGNTTLWSDILEVADELLAVRSLARGAPEPSYPPFLMRAMLYPAAEAAFIDAVVRPEVHPAPIDVNRYYIAHSELYIGPRQTQVRYIFFRALDPSQLDSIRRATTNLEDLRSRIVREELTFEDAAAQYSQAPSARRGGLIPAFEPGTHFAEFEYQAFALRRAGELSPVFGGNEGAYLLGLVGRTEERKLPIEEAREEIIERLRIEQVSPYYRLALGKLRRKTFTDNRSGLWEFGDLATPLALVGERELSRNQVMRINPAVVNADYVIQWQLVFSEISRWIEGEIIFDAVTSLRLDDHPYIQRARRIARTIFTARAELARRAGPSRFGTLEQAMEALGGGSDATDPDETQTVGVPQSRVIKILIKARREAFEEPGRAESVQDLMNKIAGQISSGYFPTRPEPLPIDETLRTIYETRPSDLEDLIDEINSRLELSVFLDIDSIKVTDMDWRDALPGLAWRPEIIGLYTGQIAAGASTGRRQAFFYILDERVDRDSFWLQVPLALQTAAFELEKRNLLDLETERIREERSASVQSGGGR